MITSRVKLERFVRFSELFLSPKIIVIVKKPFGVGVGNLFRKGVRNSYEMLFETPIKCKLTKKEGRWGEVEKKLLEEPPREIANDLDDFS